MILITSNFGILDAKRPKFEKTADAFIREVWV